jgi:hypothetical protein
MSKLKMLFFTLLLGPLFPILGVTGNGDSGDSGDSKDSEDSEDSGNVDEENNDEGGSENDDKDSDTGKNQVTMTRKDFDKLIIHRVKRAEKNAFKKYEEQKKKDQMTETEKLKFEKEEAEKKANQQLEKSNLRLIKSEVISQCTKLGIVSSNAAFKLMDLDDIEIDDNDKVTGVKDSLKALIKEYPFLTDNNNSNTGGKGKPGGDDQNKNSSNKNKTFDMNQLIRKAAGYL